MAKKNHKTCAEFADSHKDVKTNTVLNQSTVHLLGDRELLRRIFLLPELPAYVTELAKRYETALNELEFNLQQLKAVADELEELHYSTLEKTNHINR